MSNSIRLNRTQIEKLIEVYKHFPEVKHFSVDVNWSSGIGAGISVSFDLFDSGDTKIDITDVSEW